MRFSQSEQSAIALATALHMSRKSGGGSDDQRELKQLVDGLKGRDEEIKQFAEKAASEIKNLGTITVETKGALEKLAADGIKMTDRLVEIEQKLARRGGDDQQRVKSIGEICTEHDELVALAAKGRGIARMPVKAVTTITSATTGTGGVGVAIQPDRVQGILTPPQREFTIRDLIMPGRTSSNSIEFVQETGFQNMAGPQPGEGGEKAQSDIKFSMETTTVKTLAHFVVASKQVLSDLPLLQSYIDGRLRYGLKYVEEEQILAGDGTEQNLLGLIPQATPFMESLRKAGDTMIKTLRRAILQVRLAEYRASAIVLNPFDWADIEMDTDSNGRYIWVNVSEGGQPRMWRLPVVDTNAMPQGSFMVGAFNMAAQIFDREDAAVEVSTEDTDNFRRNKVTIRAEERLALAVYRPESFVFGDFEAAGVGG